MLQQIPSTRSTDKQTVASSPSQIRPNSSCAHARSPNAPIAATVDDTKSIASRDTGNHNQGPWRCVHGTAGKLPRWGGTVHVSPQLSCPLISSGTGTVGIGPCVPDEGPRELSHNRIHIIPGSVEGGSMTARNYRDSWNTGPVADGVYEVEFAPGRPNWCISCSSLLSKVVLLPVCR